MKTKNYLFLCLSILVGIDVFGQEANTDQLPKPRRFIDRIEIFVGPNLSFNYGNKFIDNYSDEFVKNTRQTKVGYSFGLGAYHRVNDRLDVNMRFYIEQNGTNSQMDTPSLKIDSKYEYQYLGVSIAPRIHIGKHRKFALAFGGYYSKIQSVKGNVSVLDIKNNVTFLSNFEGRQIRELRNDGSTSSLTFAPGLQSFEDDDFGVIFSLGYLININPSNQISIQLQDNFGLSNINKPLNGTVNPSEKNHIISFLVGYVLTRSPKHKLKF